MELDCSYHSFSKKTELCKPAVVGKNINKEGPYGRNTRTKSNKEKNQGNERTLSKRNLNIREKYTHICMRRSMHFQLTIKSRGETKRRRRSHLLEKKKRKKEKKTIVQE